MDEPELFRLIFDPMHTPRSGKRGAPAYLMLTEALEQVAVETDPPLNIDLAACWQPSANDLAASVSPSGRAKRGTVLLHHPRNELVP